MSRKFDYSRFKHDINLSQYAAHLGYELDRSKSTRSSVAMRHSNGDKVIISRRAGVWIYFSVHDDSDNGTIVDFARKRTGKTFSEVASDLNSWLGGGASLPKLQTYIPCVEEQAYDRERVKRLYRRVRPITTHPYLVKTRKISHDVLADPRFTGRIYQDFYGNVVFPSYDKEGICGLELKNHDKGVFVKGSAKGLWVSRIEASDTVLVIAESVIDALSYCALFRNSHTVYAAVSGGMKKGRQYDLVLSLMKAMPNLQTVILAVDNDQGGTKIAAKLKKSIENAGFFQGNVQLHVPDLAGDDWNEVLKRH